MAIWSTRWLSEMLRIRHAAEQRGGRCCVVTDHPGLLSILKNTALDRVFPIYATIDEALAS